MLAKEIKICKRKFNIFDESKILFVPIIITLAESKNRMVKKVPIIPVLALRNFLAEFDLYIKDCINLIHLTP